MITTKEYPATHSMSTSWFGIDKDGNVAILDFDDNGPVPTGIPETTPEGIIFEQMVDSTKDLPSLDFNDDQANEILKELVKYNGDEDIYCGIYSTIIQVDIERLEEFEALIRRGNEEAGSNLDWKTIILNKKLGLYLVNTDAWEEVRIEQLLRSGLIKNKLPYELSIWFNDKWDKEKKQYFYEVIFFNLPFFAFKQPYWPNFPMKKVYIPHYPFKADKLPKEALRKAFKFDFSFHEVEDLQIASYFPYRMYSYEDIEIMDDIDCTWLPINDKEEALLPESPIPPFRKEEFYSENNISYSEVKNSGIIFYPSMATFYPKYIRLTLCKECHNDSPLREVNGELAQLPIISFYPVSKEKIRKEKGNISLWQLEREITYDTSIIRNRFIIEKSIFEVNINLFRPYLLIISNEALRLLKDFYEINKNRIKIGEFDYQYVICDILRPGEISFEEWEALPYRGKENEILIKKRKRRDD